MAIWRYADKIHEIDLIKNAAGLSTCPFCSSNLDLLRDFIEDKGVSHEYETTIRQFWACPVCGWWKGNESFSHSEYGWRFHSKGGAAASLLGLDLSDISMPVDEVRSYLAAKYEARFQVDPRTFELVVASVFRDHGYLAEATAYSNDGGIDVVLRDESEQRVGVQVKRYKNSIEVDQIRSFAGALLLGGMTKGIFVTTSKFQKGGAETAAKADLRGISIELQDAVSLGFPKNSAACNVSVCYRSHRELHRSN